MRILTTILMLCLPMAAMSETYVCTTEKRYLLAEDGELENMVNNAAAYPYPVYVLDIEKGFRTLAEIDDYSGSCQREGDKLVKDVGESKVIALIQRKRRQGLSIRAIAEELNSKGIKPKKAEKWNPSSVHYLLKRAA